MIIQKNTRKQYLDIAKGIGIILVVLGHCPQVYNLLKQWIYAFHMPLFFIVSGTVWCRTSHESKGYFNKIFLVDKVKRLVVPCYLWGIIYMILNALIDKSFSVVNIAYLLYGSQSGFSHAGSLTSLWFLPCMFFAVCLFEAIQMTLEKEDKEASILLISIVSMVIGFFLPRISGGYPWSLDVAFLAVAFMFWGYLGKKYFEKIKAFWGFGMVTAIAVILLTLTFGLNLPYVSINNADMAGRFLGNPVFYLLDSVTGSVAVLSASKLLEKVSIIKRSLAYLGKITIPIFIIHKPVVQVLGELLSRVGIPDIVIVMVSVVAALGISIVAYIIIRRVFPAAFGEKRYKSVIIGL